MSAPVSATTGARIRELREALGLTPVSLALKANMREGELARVEAGIGEWPDAKLMRLARALGVTVAYLRGEEDHDELETSALYRLFRSLLLRCTPEHRRRILVTLIEGVERVRRGGFASS